MFKHLVFLLLINTAWAQEAPQNEGIMVDGILRERGTRKPLADVNVFLLPKGLKATTNREGKFRLGPVPPGEHQWIVNLTGYERLVKDTTLRPETTALSAPVALYLEKVSYQGFETTVYGKQEVRDKTTKTLTVDELKTLPGANGDAVKAVQNLPGVARQFGFSSEIVIQGSNPEDTQYTIDGHEVPLIFHFGGLKSVTPSEALDRVEYLSAGFGPEYGRAMGGIVGVWTRPLREDRVHGLAYVDLFNAGGLIEVPANKNHKFLLSARKSYIGEVLRLVAEDNDDFDLTVAPSFADLTAIYDTKLTPIDQFKVMSIASQDTLEFLLKNPVNADPALRGEFSNKTAFYRVIPQWTHRHSHLSESKWSLGLGRDFIRVNLGDNFFNLNTYQATVRGEVQRQMTPEWNSFWGVDHRVTKANVELELPLFFSQGGVISPFGTTDVVRENITETTYNWGFYWRNEVKPNQTPWTFIPGARLDYVPKTEQWLPAPRLATNYQLTEYTLLRSAGGLYYQPPQPQETNRSVGNPDLTTPYSWHGTLGVEKDFREGRSNGFTLSLGGFYRYFDNQVVQSTNFINVGGEVRPERYNNSGRGRAFGGETWLRYRWDRLTGWLSYTLSRSTRWDEFSPEEQVSEFDQTHNVNFIFAVDLPGNWKFSSRFRYVTGNPTTPITGGTFDSDNNTYVPTRGPFFSERLEPFMQLDMRIDKKWVYDWWILSVYLDFQNLTNRKNTEAIRYAYDYSESTSVSGLPALPTLGVQGEF